MADVTENIDWAKYAGKPEMICVCRCAYAVAEDGEEISAFMSHVQIVNGRLRTEKPCPLCRRDDNLRSASTGRLAE